MLHMKMFPQSWQAGVHGLEMFVHLNDRYARKERPEMLPGLLPEICLVVNASFRNAS